jgi:hypothetical protein
MQHQSLSGSVEPTSGDHADLSYHDHSLPLASLHSLPGSANITLRAPDTSTTDTSGINTLRKVRLAMENWTSALGPVEDWPRIFREKYDKACCDTSALTTQMAIDVFLAQVGEHVRIGKAIVAGIQECSLVKLPMSQSIEGDRLLAGDMLVTLHRGIAILEARLEIHAPSGPHVSDLHSSIRRHHGFKDLI